MSLIGGYYSFQHKRMSTDTLLTKCKQLKPLSSESENIKSFSLLEFEFGHLFYAVDKKARSLISCSSTQNTIFLSLGYLTRHNWEDWSFSDSSLVLKTDEADLIEHDIEKFQGEFTAVIYKKESKSLHIVNDRFAARPLFFLQTKDGFYFCSNFLLLLHLTDHIPQFDPIGLLQIFHFGHTIDTYTHTIGVKRLYPATHLCIAKSNVAEKRYWHLKYEPAGQLDHASYAQAVFEAFREGVHQRVKLIDKRGILALSGGLDSRLIAACIPKESNFRFVTFTSDAQNLRHEVQVASEVSRILGFPHLTTEFPEQLISQNALDLTLTTAGLLQFQHCVKALQLMEFIRSESDLFLDGGPGDVLVGSYVPSIFHTDPSRCCQQCDRYSTIDRNSELAYFFQRDFLEAHFTGFQNHFKQTMSSDTGPTAAHRISAWKMVHRQAPKTFSNPAHNYPYAMTIRPHLTYSYNDLILKLPAIWLYKRLFYQYMIYRCIPQLRQVINVNTGTVLTGQIQKHQLPPIYYRWLAVKRRTRALFRIGGIQDVATNPYEFRLIQNDKKLLRDLREILNSSKMFRDIFNIQNYMRYIEAIENSQPLYPRLYESDKPVGSLSGILYFYKYFKG